MPVANGKVETAFDKIDDPVAEIQVEFETRMPGCKSQEDRRHAMAAEQERHAHAEPARNLAPTAFQHCLAALDLVERAQTAFVIDLAVFGETLASGGAVEEARCKALFQAGNGFADGRSRKVQTRCRGREPPGVHSFDKDGNAGQAISHDA